MYRFLKLTLVFVSFIYRHISVIKRSTATRYSCLHDNEFRFKRFRLRNNFWMDFNPYELCTQTYTQKYSCLNTENSKKNTNSRGIITSFSTTFENYFALKQLKTGEFKKNPKVFRFKTAENCWDAQNLPYVTVSETFIRLSSETSLFREGKHAISHILM